MNFVDDGVNFCLVVVYKEGSMFRIVDPKKFESLMNKGCRNSKHIETWAKKVFRDFQKHHGFHAKLSIVDLLEHKDVTSFVDMLVIFMLQIMKQSKSLYPPTSISNMFCVVVRLIWFRQEQSTIENGVALGKKLNILIDANYHEMKLVANAVVLQSFKVGLGRIITKSDILTIDQEAIMFAFNHCSLKTPNGMNNKFFIRVG